MFEFDDGLSFVDLRPRDVIGGWILVLVLFLVAFSPSLLRALSAEQSAEIHQDAPVGGERSGYMFRIPARPLRQFEI